MELVGTPKQLRVAGLLGQGLNEREIGLELGIAQRTVKQHVKHLAWKNGIAGQGRWSHLAVRLVAKTVEGSAPMPANLLNSRHQVICKLVSEGKTNSEIGQIVGNTTQVVKNYLRVIYDRTGTWNRSELAGWYIARTNFVLDNSLGF
jgi:DNA-binding NarL/FixJ family response regulator